MLTLNGIDDVKAHVGQELGVSDWQEVTQEDVDRFAEATGDHQWIHVDPERAKETPFGGTIAHGYLTLSLVPMLAAQLFHIDTMGAKLNYGVNKVRFPHPVPVGSRIRGTVTIADVSDVPAGKQMITRYVVEIEDEAKPACVAETVVLLLDG